MKCGAMVTGFMGQWQCGKEALPGDALCFGHKGHAQAKSEAELLAAAKHAVSGHPNIEALRRAAFIAGWRACVAAIPLVKCATADCVHCRQIDGAAVVAEEQLEKHVAEKGL